MDSDPIKVVVRVRPLQQGEANGGTCLRIDPNGTAISLKMPEKHSYAQTPSRMARTPKGCRTAPRQPTVVSSGDATPHRPRPRLSFAPAQVAKTPGLAATPRRNAATPGAQEWKTFHFDKVLDMGTSQEDMFSQVQPFVENAIAGYNCTVFAYGQTGAGKTHTMMGSTDHGIIPRAVKHIYDEVSSTPGTTYSVRLTYVELYMDKFTDLLDPSNDPATRRHLLPAELEKLRARDSIKVKQGEGNRVFLHGSKTLDMPVASYESAMDLIMQGQRCRSVARTEENSVSSRAHTVLTFTIERSPAGSDAAPTIGKIHLVDLAGNERLAKSKAAGSVRKETQRINASLTVLGTVLHRLSDPHTRRSEVPFRDSKLTHLLQDSLGGNSKTFFVVNVRPDAASFRDSLLSLNYAQRAKQITNHAAVNVDRNHHGDICALRKQLSSLETALQEAKSRCSRLLREQEEQAGQKKALAQELAVVKSQRYQKTTKLQQELEKATSLVQFHSRTAAEEGYRAASAQLDITLAEKRVIDAEHNVTEQWDRIAKLEFDLRKEERVVKHLRARNAELEADVISANKAAKAAAQAHDDDLEMRDEEAQTLESKLNDARQERDDALVQLEHERELRREQKRALEAKNGALEARIRKLEAAVRKAADASEYDDEDVEDVAEPKRTRVTAVPKALHVPAEEEEEEGQDFFPSPAAVKKKTKSKAQKQKAARQAEEAARAKAEREKEKGRKARERKEKAAAKAKAKQASQTKAAKGSKKRMCQLADVDPDESVILGVVESEAKDLFFSNCRVPLGNATKSKKAQLELEDSFFGAVPGMPAPRPAAAAATAAAAAFLQAEEAPVTVEEAEEEQPPMPEAIEEDEEMAEAEEQPPTPEEEEPMEEEDEEETPATPVQKMKKMKEKKLEPEPEEVVVEEEKVEKKGTRRLPGAGKAKRSAGKKRSIEEVLSTSSPVTSIAGVEAENVPNSPLFKISSGLDMSKAFVASPMKEARKPATKKRRLGKKNVSSLLGTPGAPSPVSRTRPTAARHTALAAAFQPKPRRSIRLGNFS
mmetsp:Transcript_10335/g.42035  ORF Transcript_10335/g.42035 Transcript_10335/m.42035 type:complete len:1050 (+) Transcript_10335:47-3196(+)